MPRALTGDTMPKPPMSDPRAFRCEACNARIGQACNAPTDTGRRNVAWFHSMRESRAIEALQDPDHA